MGQRRPLVSEFGRFNANKSAHRKTKLKVPGNKIIPDMPPDNGNATWTVFVPCHAVFPFGNHSTDGMRDGKDFASNDGEGHGFGLWNLAHYLSQRCFSLREYSLDEVITPRREEHACWNICLMTLDCGSQLISKYVKIRQDLDSCDEIAAKRMPQILLDPLSRHLFDLAELSELPYFEPKLDAGVKLLRDVKKS